MHVLQLLKQESMSRPSSYILSEKSLLSKVSVVIRWMVDMKLGTMLTLRHSIGESNEEGKNYHFANNSYCHFASVLKAVISAECEARCDDWAWVQLHIRSRGLHLITTRRIRCYSFSSTSQFFRSCLMHCYSLPCLQITHSTPSFLSFHYRLSEHQAVSSIATY